jgi:hypothetical protein
METKFTIISGYNMTGKTVVTDLLKEFDVFNIPAHTAEFNLLRIQGGLLDLYNALEEDWSPIRSDAAIRRFKKVVLKLGSKAELRKPASLFIANGMNYNNYFNNNFFNITDRYIGSLIDYTYNIEWPYLSIDNGPLNQFLERIYRGLNKKKIFHSEVYGSLQNHFIVNTRNYIDELFNSISLDGPKNFVLHNAVEPFNPTRGLNLFNDAKIIIVHRDPRDVYASNYVRNEAFSPSFEVARHWELKMGLTSAGNIETFIKRQKAQYDRVKSNSDDSRILRLSFEQIVMNHESTIKSICSFLNMNEKQQIRKGEFFKPELSKKNIGLWKLMKNQTNILLIENELNKYCYNG